MDGTAEGRPSHGELSSYGKWLTTVIVAACFWTAIVLPSVYVPLLVAGLETSAEGLALVALFVVNLVTLLVGHSYHSG